MAGKGCAVFIRQWAGGDAAGRHYHVKVKAPGRTVSDKFDTYREAETFARRVMRWVFPDHRVLKEEECGLDPIPSGRRWFYGRDGD